MDELEYFDEADKQEFVGHLIESDELEGAALGVAKLYVDKGRTALSDRQQLVLD